MVIYLSVQLIFRPSERKRKLFVSIKI
ncbi:hypothetical protein Nmel_007926 [Mimus melanotis]